jgi:hypothetical protein
MFILHFSFYFAPLFPPTNLSKLTKLFFYQPLLYGRRLCQIKRFGAEDSKNPLLKLH